MNATVKLDSAVTVRTQYVDAGGRRLAYRSLGDGTPIVLCTRFRGNLDTWDPAFLDALAARGFRVVTFDYSGLGLSSGQPTYNPFEMAHDPIDLADALGLKKFVIGGWSIGGLAAQVAFFQNPERISQVVLIGTTPPGPAAKLAEQLFYDTAAIENCGLEEDTILFFEPRSKASRAAAARCAERMRQRTRDLSPPVPIDFARAALAAGPRPNPFPAEHVLALLKTTATPILHIGGDHDIIFPVENWYALNGQLPSVQLLTYPAAGHGPQHERPEESAIHIAAFVHGDRLATHL